jgi:hypothetical protein
MSKLVKYSCVDDLKILDKPVIIFAVPDEAEAVLNACKENKIKVSAFLTQLDLGDRRSP